MDWASFLFEPTFTKVIMCAVYTHSDVYFICSCVHTRIFAQVGKLNLPAYVPREEQEVLIAFN